MNLKLSSSFLLATTIFTLVLPAYAGVSNLATSSSSTVNQFERLTPKAELMSEEVAQTTLPATFPMNGEREDNVWKDGKGKMKTSFTLDSNGNLQASTKTWNDSRFAGFVGGVYIAFTDASGFRIWNTEQQKYGVDGKKIGNSNRTENWQATVPPEILNRIEGYAIVQEHTPRGIINLESIKKVYVLFGSN